MKLPNEYSKVLGKHVRLHQQHAQLVDTNSSGPLTQREYHRLKRTAALQGHLPSVQLGQPVGGLHTVQLQRDVNQVWTGSEQCSNAIRQSYSSHID